MSIDGRKIEQTKLKESEDQKKFSSEQYQEVFYGKKNKMRVFQKEYESLPHVTIEKDLGEKDISYKLQRYNIDEHGYTFIKLEQVRAKIQEINNTNGRTKLSDLSVANQQKDLMKIEISLRDSLEKRRQYEIDLIKRVDKLKDIVKKVKALTRFQYAKNNGLGLLKTIQRSIKEAHIALVRNADQLGTNTHWYFHDSQLHPCPPKLRIRMLQQKPRSNDCGAACVTALYATREKIESLSDLSKDIYRRYPSEDLNKRGTNMQQHVQVLGDLGVQTERFSSTKDLRMRLNKREKDNPIIALIGRHDTNEGHFITISNTTIDRGGEEMIAFANPRTGQSYLISFNEFLDVSGKKYLQLI